MREGKGFVLGKKMFFILVKVTLINLRRICRRITDCYYLITLEHEHSRLLRTRPFYVELKIEVLLLIAMQLIWYNLGEIDATRSRQVCDFSPLSVKWYRGHWPFPSSHLPSFSQTPPFLIVGKGRETGSAGLDGRYWKCYSPTTPRAPRSNKEAWARESSVSKWGLAQLSAFLGKTNLIYSEKESVHKTDFIWRKTCLILKQ